RRLRSVDSERVGRAIQPRKINQSWFAERVRIREGSNGSRGPRPPGSKSAARERGGPPRNLGGPALPPRSRLGKPVNNPGPVGDASDSAGSERRTRVVPARQRRAERERDERQGVGAPRSTDEAGELNSRGAGGGKGAPEHGTAGGKESGNFESQHCLNETTADSDTGESREASAHHARPPHRRRLAEGGLSAHAQGRGDRSRRDDSSGIRGAAGGKSPVATQPSQDRRVPSARGAARLHPEGGRRSASHRHSNLRGQAAAASGAHGAGACLRA